MIFPQSDGGDLGVMNISDSTTRWRPAESSDSLEVHLLGLVDFESALFLQERLVYEISGRNDQQGGLLLCEHPPMVTIGREGSRSQLPLDSRELTARQMPVRWINRGGESLVHAPGQLAVYPIIPLKRRNLGLVEYRRRLSAAVVDVARELQVQAEQHPDEPGVWCRTGRFASVGIAVKSWVSYQGVFVNVAPAVEFLELVAPRRRDDRITSLATQRQAVTAMPKVRESVIRQLAAQLGYTNLHVYTGHPLLHRTQKRVYVPA